jgi:hypothetical protein
VQPELRSQDSGTSRQLITNLIVCSAGGASFNEMSSQKRDTSRQSSRTSIFEHMLGFYGDESSKVTNSNAPVSAAIFAEMEEQLAKEEEARALADRPDLETLTKTENYLKYSEVFSEKNEEDKEENEVVDNRNNTIEDENKKSGADSEQVDFSSQENSKYFRGTKLDSPEAYDAGKCYVHNLLCTSLIAP